MIDITLIRDILFPKEHPSIPNLRLRAKDELFSEGLPMGTLVVGKQGSGKTSFLARHIVDYFKKFPKRAIFVLDWSGSITENILSLILQEKEDIRDGLLGRVVYDELGNSKWVIPFPEFSHLYGSTKDEQIDRVKTNWVKLTEYLTREATILGGVAIKGIAPAIFKVLVSCEGVGGGTWQVTEFGRFIDNPKMLADVFRKHGAYIPARTREFLTKRLVNVKANESELRTYALSEILSSIESPASLPRLGYPRPGWTPREAIRKGLLVLVNGGNLINQRSAQHYLFTQAYSLIMAEINKRTPANPKDEPVALVLDEVYSLLQIPGMAEEVGMISPIYRSRKLELYVVIQALWQLAENLRKQIWSLGNVVSFGVENFNEAYEIAQQLFFYEPKSVKVPSKTTRQHPVFEPGRGQYLEQANWIQSFVNRECIMRRYISEAAKDPYVRHVSKTIELPSSPLNEPIEVVKERLLTERGVKITDALAEIDKRKISATPKITKPPQI